MTTIQSDDENLQDLAAFGESDDAMVEFELMDEDVDFHDPEVRAAEVYMNDMPIFFDGGHITFDQQGWIEVFYEDRGVVVEAQVEPEMELILWRSFNTIPSEALEKGMKKLRVALSKAEKAKKKSAEPEKIVLDAMMELAQKGGYAG